MGMVRTLGAALAVKGTPTPAVLAAAGYTPAPLAVASFFIRNGVATIILGSEAFPANGLNGPNQKIQGYPANPAGGEQVTLWGFGTATYFNGKKVSIISNDPGRKSFSFYFNHANVGSYGSPTADTSGLVGPSPFQHYRAVRLECGASLSTDVIYVGDLNVSSSQYMAALSLASQLSVEIASENIPPEGVMIDTSGSGPGDTVQVSVIY